MIEQQYIPFIAGIIGALLGSAGSILAIILQSRSQDKRERIRIAVEIARAEHEAHREILIRNGGGKMPPVSLYINYHLKLYGLIEKGKLSEKTFTELSEEYDRLSKEIQNIEAQKKRKKAEPVAGGDATRWRE